MGAPSATAIKGPAPPTRQAAHAQTKATPKPHAVAHLLPETAAPVVAPPSCSAIPALAPGESTDPGSDDTPIFLQRKCAACATEDEEAVNVQRQISVMPEPLWLQRKCSQCENEEEQQTELQRKPSNTSITRASQHERLVREALARSQGEPLSPPIRLLMESAYSVRLDNVRIHHDALAQQASDAVAAHAFTVGQSIYFAAGRYQPNTRSGRELLAHELAHVVQNRNPAAPASTHKRALQVSQAQAPAEIEADAAAKAVIAGRPFHVRGSAQASLHRKEKDALGQLVDWGKTRIDEAESAVATGVEDVVKYTGEQVMKLLRSVAPELAAIIDEGPVTFAKRKVSEALDAHLPAAMGGFSVSDMAKGVTSWFSEAGSFIKNLLKGDSDACKSFTHFMHTLSGYVGKLIDNPVIDAMTGALTKVNDFVVKLLKLIGEPLFDGLKSVVSGAWSAIKKVASTLSGWFTAAKNALGAAWTELMKLLGFDGSSEDGVWSWIKEQAGKVWDSIKAAVAPALEPLKKIASVVALLTPMGQIHAIVKYGPKLVQVVQWIWNNGLSPEKIREAPAEIRGMLESLHSGVSGFKNILKTGLDWLSEKLSALGDAVLNTASTVTGLPLLSFAHNLFNDARNELNTLVTYVKKGAEDSFKAIVDAEDKAEKFIAPYKEVISSLILAIASPPMIPVILAGWGWRALPRCVKVPILDFILDIAIKAVAKIPALPTFDLLWPLLKPAVLGFLETLRAASDEVKEKVSNKLAKLISGASPAFLIAFVKGFAKGVWDGITDPIKAILMVLNGLDAATQYLLSLAGMEDKEKYSRFDTSDEVELEKQEPVVAQKKSLVAEKPATQATPMAGGDLAEVTRMAKDAAQELQPDVDVVKSGFWDAVQEYFNGGSMSFTDMTQRLSAAWDAAKEKIRAGGAWLASQLMQFFGGSGEGDETKVGDQVGQLTGNLVLQAVLDLVTADTWTLGGPILKAIAKFINWPMEAMGEVFKLFKSLGKLLLDGLKRLGSAIKESAGGAFRAVSKAIGHIGEKLMAMGERIIGKLGGKAARAESKAIGALEKQALEKEGAKLGEHEAAKVTGAGKAVEGKLPEAKAPHEGEFKPKQSSAGGEAATKAEREASAKETGHIESKKLSKPELHNETEMLSEHPGMLEGTPPNRRAKVGEHEWIEQPMENGKCRFCRHSSPVCVDTPELRTDAMKHAEEAAADMRNKAQLAADEAAAARQKALAHPDLSKENRELLEAQFKNANERAKTAREELSAAQKERDSVKGISGKAATEQRKAAKAKIQQMERELAAAEHDAAASRRLLDERKQMFAKAEEAEARAATAANEAGRVGAETTEQRTLTDAVEKAEEKLRQLHEKNKLSKSFMRPVSGGEILRAEMERNAALKKLQDRVEKSLGLTSEVVDDLRRKAPFGAAGGAERFRDFLDSMAPGSKGPGGKYRDYVTGLLHDTKDLHIDHIVPFNDIVRMPGFAKLNPDNRHILLDLKENLAYLEGKLNSSKQEKSLAQWFAGRADLVKAQGAGRIGELAKVETDARQALEKKLQELLEKQGPP
ncbi:DUF4157 domain-containing protein [Dyella sp. M7H15-1]|uniref:eCIS core domain-containing protein n=1 Tax=Dyella sp. M7H15-1 TaxID=2501295 RepID=UPI001004E721|nr:DUF4157 domain-containing protein [Dyella sp. M7H15-1]QAU23616.1 DUF4157 domain-containing protein [Dyella sp. M7H15-1]